MTKSVFASGRDGRFWMPSFGLSWSFGCLALSAFLLSPCVPVRAQTEFTRADLLEIIDAVASSNAGVSEDDLARAALDGIQRAFPGQARLSGEETDAEAPLRAERILDDRFVYLNVAACSGALPEKVREVWRSHEERGARKGLILDLRRCAGRDFRAAVRVADLFVDDSGEALQIGDVSIAFRDAGRDIAAPVAVLISKNTSGAAETLAALTRRHGAGLLIGEATAGDAAPFRPLRLTSGREALIAGDRVAFADGSILSEAVRPDIEAEAGNAGATAGDPADPASLAKDPALARAVDFLKGLALLKSD